MQIIFFSQNFHFNCLYLLFITTSLLSPTDLHKYETNVYKHFFNSKLFYLILYNCCDNFKYQSLSFKFIYVIHITKIITSSKPSYFICLPYPPTLPTYTTKQNLYN